MSLFPNPFRRSNLMSIRSPTADLPMVPLSERTVINVAGLRRVEAMADKAGLSSETLMERAGAAIAREAEAMLATGGGGRRVVVLCGPGKNGMDGLIAARHLAKTSDVRVGLLASKDGPSRFINLKEAPLPFKQKPLKPELLEGVDLVIDALFGIGLDRPLEGEAAACAAVARELGLRVLAVDLPSGLAADSAFPLGNAFIAERTISFLFKKLAHFLYPASDYCGRVVLDDLGVGEVVSEGALVEALYSTALINEPSLWHALYRSRAMRMPGTHKYHFGYLLVGQGELAGAALLAARAGLRAGAGVVSLITTPEREGACLASAPGLIVRTSPEGIQALPQAVAAETRRAVAVLGPGLDVGGRDGDAESVRALVLETVRVARHSVVLDAGALTAFSGKAEVLFSALRDRASHRRHVVLTPHDGEYDALFLGHEAYPGANDKVSRLERARALASAARAVVILKGCDTVVATPRAHAAVSYPLPSALATAGSGDVLAGIVGGLLAQSMPPFEAACAAVWMHAEAARALGPGLIAEDLEHALRPVIARLVKGFPAGESSVV